MINFLQQKSVAMQKFQLFTICGLCLFLGGWNAVHIHAAYAACSDNADRIKVNRIIESIKPFDRCLKEGDIPVSQADIGAKEKIKTIQMMGQDAIPYLIENIISDKKEDMMQGGVSAIALCALSTLYGDKINWNAVNDIVDSYYPAGIYAPNYPYDLKRKIQTELIKQIGFVECQFNEDDICCRIQ